MKRLFFLSLMGLQLASAKSVTKGTSVYWSSDHPKAVSVFNDQSGERIGDLRDGKLHQEFDNFVKVPWSIRDAENKVLEKGVARVEMYFYEDDSLPQDVPKGKLLTHEWNESKIYAGTKRHYQIYVPAQYDPVRHASPSGSVRATVVMDNLIAKEEIPVTLGVFVNPGHFKDQEFSEKPGNRSVEYDSLDDTYARFLLEEILPEVEKTYKVSQDPKMRAVAGGASGGICAWTLCWEKPGSFQKALIWGGSFVDIRGGDKYAQMIRKTEKKPIEVYLLAGSNDLDNQYGNWALANQQVAASLKFAGYEHLFDYGKSFHGSKEAGAKFPEMLSWLWRDWQEDQAAMKGAEKASSKE